MTLSLIGNTFFLPCLVAICNEKKNTWLSPPCWLNVDLAAVAQGYPKKTARLNECAKDETLRTCIWPNIKKDPAVPSHLVGADDLLVFVARQYLIIAISSRLLIGRKTIQALSGVDALQ